jgi:hypothetical protein
MSGQFLRTPEQRSHVCPLPDESIPTWTSQPVGTVWQCDCELVWVVERVPTVRYGGRATVAHNEWRRESRRERRRRLGLRWWRREKR